MSRSALADANESRDWRIYAEFAQPLIRTARRLYAKDSLAVELADTVYALDATTIDLCLSLFPVGDVSLHQGGREAAHAARSARSDPQLHPHLRRQTARRQCARRADYRARRLLRHGSRLPRLRAALPLDQAGGFFVTRAKSNFECRRVYLGRSIAARDCSATRQCQLVVFYSRQAYPDTLRRIRYRDAEGRRLVFLTNHMTLPPLTICALYRCRWQVELFFKWIKQHLRIKRFFGTSENAVKTQIWIAVASTCLVAIVRKRLNLELSLHEMLQILSITPFEKTPMIQLLTYSATSENIYNDPNQLILL